MSAPAPVLVNLNSTTQYTANSVPCKIRYTGEHSSLPLHFTKLEEKNHTVTYLRGRKLHGEQVNLEGLTGHLLTKEYDEVKNLGQVKETVWFEREGHEMLVGSKIKEGLVLSELIHG